MIILLLTYDLNFARLFLVPGVHSGDACHAVRGPQCTYSVQRMAARETPSRRGATQLVFSVAQNITETFYDFFFPGKTLPLN